MILLLGLRFLIYSSALNLGKYQSKISTLSTTFSVDNSISESSEYKSSKSCPYKSTSIFVFSCFTISLWIFWFLCTIFFCFWKPKISSFLCNMCESIETLRYLSGLFLKISWFFMIDDWIADKLFRIAEMLLVMFELSVHYLLKGVLSVFILYLLRNFSVKEFISDWKQFSVEWSFFLQNSQITSTWLYACSKMSFSLIEKKVSKSRSSSIKQYFQSSYFRV